MIIKGNLGDFAKIIPTWISIDPGETSGITTWNDSGNPIHYNEFDIPNLHKFLDWLEQIKTDFLRKIIIEEYRLYQSKALQQSGSHLETVQVIGMIKRCNYKLNLPDVVEVRADSKDIAAKWSGVKLPKGHTPDWMSSYLIGYYWLHKHGIIPARVLEQS
jgi:hypothetical protein